VVARSYVLSMRKGRHNGQGFEFCDQPHCQVFHGIARAEDYPGLAKRIRETRGEIITYQRRPIPAFYHHNCGGMTSAIEDVWPAPGRPYLKAVVEPAEGVCRKDPRAAWKTRLSKKRISQCFRDAGVLKRKETVDQIKISLIDASGRARSLDLIGKEKHTITVGRFRNLINREYKTEVLKSALFTMSSDGDSFVVQGRGWGHGVGFCQEGAKWMAQHGKTYQDILQHYFPHTTLQKI
jgi:stage II sporulation protein D